MLRDEPEASARDAAVAMHAAATVLARRVDTLPPFADGHLWTDLSLSGTEALASEVDAPGNLVIHPREDLEALVDSVGDIALRERFRANLEHRLCVNVGIWADNAKLTVGSLFSSEGRRPEDDPNRNSGALTRAARKFKSGIGFHGNPRRPKEVNLLLDDDTTEATLEWAPDRASSGIRIPKQLMAEGASCDLGNIGFCVMVPGHPKLLDMLRMVNETMETGTCAPGPFSDAHGAVLQARKQANLERASGLFAPLVGDTPSTTRFDNEAGIRLFEAAEKISRSRAWFQDVVTAAAGTRLQSTDMTDIGQRALEAYAAQFLFDRSLFLVAATVTMTSSPLELGMNRDRSKLIAKFHAFSNAVLGTRPPLVTRGRWKAVPLELPDMFAQYDFPEIDVLTRARALLARYEAAFPGTESKAAATR